jgi:hypothetical protein
VKLTKRAQGVLAAAAILLVAGISLAAVPISSHPHPSVPLTAPSIPLMKDFSPLVPPQTVPRNVLDALRIPKNSQLLAWINYDRSTGAFDRSIELALPITADAEEHFFEAMLTHYGWSILSTQPSVAGSDILARIAGSDGNYWEVGIKTPFQLSGAQAKVVKTKVKASLIAITVEVRLLLVGDQ